MAPETLRALPRWLFAALLAALAVLRAGAPNGVTAAALAACAAVVAALRVAVGRGRGGFAPLRGCALFAAAALAAAGAAWLRGEVAGLELAWLFLVGVPWSLWLAAGGGPLLPRAPALTIALYASLALGLLDAAPWESLAGRALLFALALTGVAGAALDAARRLVPHGVPAPPPRAWRRATLTLVVLALLALFAAVGVDAALGPLPRRWREPPPPPPAADPIAQRIGTGGGGDGSRTLARVRWLAEEGGAPPQRLYLRERVLEELLDLDGLLYFAPRAGAPTWVPAGAAAGASGRIEWPDAAQATVPERARAACDVTLLGAPPRSLLLVDAPLWIEQEGISLGSDQSLARPQAGDGTLTYRVGADAGRLERARGGARRAAIDLERLALPDRFQGRATLEPLVARLAGEQDAGARAEAIARLLAESGRVDATESFRGWTDFAVRRAGKPLHFAQCATLLARLARLPARVVSGYATERWSEEERTFEVRAADEHHWFEVALEEVGWVGLDPCPASAASSEALDAALAAAEQARRDELDRRSLRSTFVRQRPWIVGIVLLLLLAALFAFPTVRARVERFFARRAPPGASAPVRRAWRFWQELLDLCRAAGLVAHPSWTAAEFASLVAVAVPARRAQLSDLLALYHAGRFGGVELSPEQESRVRELLQSLPRELREARRAQPAAPGRNRR